MKILVFCQYYYPERFLLTDIAEELVRRGHEVTVVTGLPSYNLPGGKVPKEYRKGLHNNECINGVRIIRCNTLGRGKSKIRMFLNYFSYVTKAKKLIDRLEKDYDIVFSYQLTPVFQTLPAIEYAKRNDKKLVCYCLDLAPESGLRMLRRIKPLANKYKKVSSDIYNSCDFIAVTSESFINYHKEVNGVPEEKLGYIPQHAPPTLLKEDLTKCVQEGERKVFLFAGNVGVGAKLGTVVTAVKKLVDDGQVGFEVRIVGDGSDKSRLEQTVLDNALGDFVKFYDGVPFDRMPEVYRSADALLITLRKGQITVPGKLQAYMSTGKPIFGAMDSAGRDMINNSQCGVCVPAESPDELAAVMNDFIENPERYSEYGENGRRYFEDNFTLDRYITSLITLFNKVIASEDE